MSDLLKETIEFLVSGGEIRLEYDEVLNAVTARLNRGTLGCRRAFHVPDMDRLDIPEEMVSLVMRGVFRSFKAAALEGK